MATSDLEIEGQGHKTIAFVALPIYTHIPNLKVLTKIFFKLSRPKGNLCGGGGVTVLNPKYPRLSSGDTIKHLRIYSRHGDLGTINPKVAYIPGRDTYPDTSIFGEHYTNGSVMYVCLSLTQYLQSLVVGIPVSNPSGLAGGNTGRLFLTFGGPVRADRISYCPLDRVLTYKNLIYLLNLQIQWWKMPKNGK